MLAQLFNVWLLRALKEYNSPLRKMFKKFKKKFVTINYKHHLKIQPVYNGNNQKLNLDKIIFFYKHPKTPTLTLLLDLYFCNQETVVNS